MPRLQIGSEFQWYDHWARSSVSLASQSDLSAGEETS
jgi:hypothetical protein